MNASGSALDYAARKRRRVLAVSALAVALPLAAWRASSPSSRTAAPLQWQGSAFGAPASITLYHDDDARAAAALRAVLAELARVESVFSLYRADSWLSRLNREGRLDAAPEEFVAVLGRALDLARATGGVYDPTVQPLWQLYYQHFVVGGASEPPPAAQRAAALARVGWQHVALDGARVALARPGMAVTLNSVAQGYATDRASAVLRAHGFDRMLVDMGEPRALAPKPDGSAWHIAIADPRDPARAIHAVDVVERAVATSGGYGTRFDEAGRYTHLLDARSGRSAPAAESVTVISPSATQADLLSTALVLLPPAARPALLAAHSGCQAICVDAAGRVLTLG